MIDKNIGSITAGIEPVVETNSTLATPRVEATRDVLIAAQENAVMPETLSELNALMKSVKENDKVIVAPSLVPIVDFDKLIEEEATAAGAGAASDGDGSTFVRLLRIVEGVDPLSYNFSTERPPLKLLDLGADLVVLDKTEDKVITPPPGPPEPPPPPPPGPPEPPPPPPPGPPEPPPPPPPGPPPGPGNGNGNNGHGNNTDGQDDDNPGQGSGGPNNPPKDGDDEDEGDRGNQGDDTPGVGNNKNSLNVDDLLTDTNEPSYNTHENIELLSVILVTKNKNFNED